MKKVVSLTASWVMAVAVGAWGEVGGGVSLAARRAPGGIVVAWTGLVTPEAAVEYRLQRADELGRWENVGDKLRLPGGSATGGVWTDPAGGRQAFYRVLSRTADSFTTADGAVASGVGGLFEDELELVRGLTPAGLAERHPAGPYLEGIGFDPATASFWREYQDPHPTTGWGAGLYSFALNAAEMARMRQSGFVVSERLGAPDFAEIYYRVFFRDLPVFITTDSILHAWHRSFDALLADMERGYLEPALRELLKGMVSGLARARDTYGAGVLRDSVRDADYYLAVALSLLAGAPAPSVLGQGARVTATLSAIQAGQYVPFQLFDIPDYVDFSQYTPRGHYPRYKLENYFRAMMWCGRVDLRVAGNPRWASLRQLGTAIVLHDLWRAAPGGGRWGDMNRVLDVLVGPADSMNLEQFGALLAARGVHSPAAIQSLADLESLRAALEDGTLGVQQIQGHAYLGGVGGQSMLPRSFALFGQRFVLDAWAMGQVTFDRIVRPGTEPPEPVRRRRSYGLDVAFSVLANDHVVPDLVANIANPDGVRFRDGFEYQHNLAAARSTVDALPAAAWTGSVYGHWLAALRALSPATTGEAYPQAMRTRAWAMRTLNGQLASWTQLKHDTVLYAKQIELPPIVCFYPAGFVEPRPEFFARMREMAIGTRAMMSGLSFELVSGTAVEPYGTASQMADKLGTFLGRFAAVCGQLEGMARKELVQEPFVAEETALIDNWMEVLTDYFGVRTYRGHYPSLFLRGNEGKLPFAPRPWPYNDAPPAHDCAQPDFLVSDVLTAGFSDPDGDPGAVLHEAVGRVNCLMIAVDNGPDRMVYAGPVFSHYEFEMPLGERLTDEAWTARVEAGNVPVAPPWTGEFLVR